MPITDLTIEPPKQTADRFDDTALFVVEGYAVDTAITLTIPQGEGIAPKRYEIRANPMEPISAAELRAISFDVEANFLSGAILHYDPTTGVISRAAASTPHIPNAATLTQPLPNFEVGARKGPNAADAQAWEQGANAGIQKITGNREAVAAYNQQALAAAVSAQDAAMGDAATPPPPPPPLPDWAQSHATVQGQVSAAAAVDPMIFAGEGAVQQ